MLALRMIVSRTHACIYPRQPDRASADGTMPKQSEDQQPQDGALPKPPRSRFRADGRRRRTSGELKKRAPYVQYWKDIQVKQREREEEQASSHRDRPQHFRIHTDESQERRSDMGVEAVGGPPLEAPVARNEKGRPVMAPEIPGTKQIGMTTGRIKTAGAGETPTRRMTQTKTGDLRKKQNTKTPKKTTLRTGTSVLTPASPTRTLPLNPPRSASLARRTEPQHHRQARDPEPHRSVTSLCDASRRPSRHRQPLQRIFVPLRFSGYTEWSSYWSSSLRRASPRCSAHTTDPATSQSITTRSMATPLQPNPRVGNWNLSLTGSLLCPHLRGIYNNAETFGSFMESFTVCNAQKTHRPAWYGNFSLLVQLIAKMMDTCTPATYDAMKWKSNPAEFIHVIRAHEVAPAPDPGEAGADNLRHLLYDTAPDVDSPPTPDPATETPAAETWIPETPPPEMLSLQLMNKPMAEQTVDSSSSHSEDVKMLTQREPTHPVAAPPPDQAHKLIGGDRRVLPLGRAPLPRLWRRQALLTGCARMAPPNR